MRAGERWRIAVAGASGFLGSALVRLIEAQGHQVLRIDRAHPGRQTDIVWDPGKGVLDVAKLEGIDAAINLTGTNVGQRWNPAVKRAIVESRVRSTELLAGAIAQLNPRPRVLLNMSAAGYYGDRKDEPVDERSKPGRGFLAQVVEQWEAATRAASDAGIRVVCARCGVVLHPSASILARLIPIFRLGVGGRIGSGRQWLSWISRTDALRALEFLLSAESLGGPVNVTSPQPVRNAEFTRVLARVVRRPAITVVPPFAVKLLYGEMGQETVLAGQRVVPRRLLEAGFQFKHPDIEDAIRWEMTNLK